MNKLKRVHEDDFKLMKWFKPHVNQVFIDIGSNRGEAITSMLIMNKSETKIIGFEPNFEIHKKLKKYTLDKNLVVIHNLGLGSNNKDSILHVPLYRKWIFDGLASFNYKNSKNWLRTRMYFYNESFLTIKESKCKIRMLDDFKLNPYFIKIDVQGLELEVLKGGKATLKNNSPILLIESINDECLKYLSPFGYQYYHFTKGFLHKGLGIINTFCINMKKHPELQTVIK